MTMLTGAIGIGEAGVYALLGYGMVFFGLILLMVVVMIMGKFFTAKKEKPAAAPVAAAPVAAPAAPVEAPVAPGTAGQLKTYDVPPKTCAMLMAIVADKMGKPLNELRFISIKEVK
jgi:Na+-transporting methylmalonyl-CoA/oxaloacetate decarboxylase gamma subunit